MGMEGEITGTPAAPAADVSVSSAPAASTSGAPASSPSTSTYDWKAWDGEDANAPETHRPALSALREKLKPQLDEHANLKRWWEGLAEEDLDPVTAELKNTVTAKDTEITQLKTAVKTAETKYAEYEAAVNAELDAEAERQVADFRAKHAEALKNPKIETFLYTMVTKLGADAESVMEALALGQGAAQAFVDMKKEGASDGVAMKHAKAVANAAPRATAPTPRAASRLVAGAEATNRPVPALDAEQTKPVGLLEWRQRAVEKAMKNS